MPKIDIIINPKNQEPIEYPGRVFYGWKCPRTDKVFRFKSAYLKHLKELALENKIRKNEEIGIVDKHRIVAKQAISEAPTRDQKQAFSRAKDFLNRAYGTNWTAEQLLALSEYILTVAIIGRRNNKNKNNI